MSYLWERGIKLHRNTTGFTPSRPYWRFPKDLLLLIPMKKQGGASGFALGAPPRNLNLAVCAQLWAVSSTIVSFQTHKEATKSRRGSTFRRELQRASSRQGEKLEKDSQFFDIPWIWSPPVSSLQDRGCFSRCTDPLLPVFMHAHPNNFTAPAQRAAWWHAGADPNAGDF